MVCVCVCVCGGGGGTPFLAQFRCWGNEVHVAWPTKLPMPVMLIMKQSLTCDCADSVNASTYGWWHSVLDALEQETVKIAEQVWIQFNYTVEMREDTTRALFLAKSW